MPCGPICYDTFVLCPASSLAPIPAYLPRARLSPSTISPVAWHAAAAWSRAAHASPPQAPLAPPGAPRPSARLRPAHVPRLVPSPARALAAPPPPAPRPPRRPPAPPRAR
eukprot:scaffold6589_cov116-Isochrysis_galbana.AAC.1